MVYFKDFLVHTWRVITIANNFSSQDSFGSYKFGVA